MKQTLNLKLQITVYISGEVILFYSIMSGHLVNELQKNI